MQNTTNNQNWVETDVEDVLTAYRAGDAKVKGGIRSALKKAGAQAVRDLNMESAVAAQTRLDAITAAPATERAEVDWTSVLATKLATYRVAVENFAQVTVPDDADVDWDEVLTAAETAEVDSDLLTSLLAQPKTGQRAAKGSIDAFLQGAVSDTFQTVSQLIKHIVPEYNEERSAGSGAVSYALNRVLTGDREIEGVIATRDEQGTLGAIAAG